jgi:hypothetical protein
VVDSPYATGPGTPGGGGGTTSSLWRHRAPNGRSGSNGGAPASSS